MISDESQTIAMPNLIPNNDDDNYDDDDDVSCDDDDGSDLRKTISLTRSKSGGFTLKVLIKPG